VILYKKSRFDLKNKGHFLLEPALSLNIPRIAVFGVFQDRITAKEFLVIGVHLDAKQNRENELKKIRSHLAPILKTDTPIFFAGDFNIDPKEDYYDLITRDMGFKNAMGDDPLPAMATFPFVLPKRRIDHVFYRGSLVRPLSTHILFSPQIYSDHRAFYVDFEIGKASP
jgi:endonuclease/exonuclease/phosphatase family metal-dependent hydrolase